MAKFIFINDKERKFKKVKMKQIIRFQEEMQKKLQEAKTTEETALAIGEMVAELIEPFEVEEILDAEQDEFIIAQAIHLLQPYYKGGRTKAEIDALVREIIDAGTMANIGQMRMGIFQ
mgnify:CR=1 FL=1